MYDIVIVGAGTAGLSAAVYAGRAGKTVLVLEGAAYGGQIINTPEIENYPGIKHTSGYEFATGLYEQAKEHGAEVKYEKVLSIADFDDEKLVKTVKNEYHAKAVILATGRTAAKLGLEKEDEFLGRGVSYCATCDGAFFKGRTVAVNGGGNTAIEDAIFLSNYCSKVYLIHRRDVFRAEKSLVDRLKEKENVEFVLNTTVTAFLGESSLEGIEILNKKTGDKDVISLQGFFVAIGQKPHNEDFENIVELEDGYIKANEDCRTKVPGVFTAGDCRTKTVRQLTTAASDGAIAALAACEYIG